MSFVRESSDILPPGSWDTHVHVFDSSIGPYAPSRSYTPSEATLEQLKTAAEGLAETGKGPNLVVIQPSPYGTDNTVLMSTLRSLKNEWSQDSRGIAVVNIEHITDFELEAMHRLGVRGIRLNLQADGRDVNVGALNAQLAGAARRIAHLPGWMIQVFIPGHVWDDLFNTIIDLPVRVIADHIGGLLGASKDPEITRSESMKQRGYKSLVELAQRGKVIIKISGLYRASTMGESNYSDLEPIITAVALEAPDQLVWASDWPHTGDGKNRASNGIEKVEPFRVVNNVAILKELRRWVGEEAWLKMMVTNPARVYT